MKDMIPDWLKVALARLGVIELVWLESNQRQLLLVKDRHPCGITTASLWGGRIRLLEDGTVRDYSGDTRWFDYYPAKDAQ